MPLSKEQLKAKFKREGKSFAQWARDNGYQYYEVVRVVNGFNKATRGRGHGIAVKLGMKNSGEEV